MLPWTSHDAVILLELIVEKDKGIVDQFLIVFGLFGIKICRLAHDNRVDHDPAIALEIGFGVFVALKALIISPFLHHCRICQQRFFQLHTASLMTGFSH
jgi:hypothetical protein